MDVITAPQASVAPPVDLANEQMLRRRREAKVRLARERVKNINRALLCSGILAALLLFGIFTGWVPLPGSSAVIPGETTLDWPADRFAETRTGQILLPSRDGTSCQQVFFNNETGLLSRSKPARCKDPVQTNSNPEPRKPQGILGALRDGFVNK
jgi:hypothetical protein